MECRIGPRAWALQVDSDVGLDGPGRAAEDDHPVGQDECLVDVVRDQERRRSVPVPHLEKVRLQIDARECIESAERLIE